MSTLWEMPAVLAALLAWLVAPPATIGDAAAREALRREFTGKATRLYTNLDLPPMTEPIGGSAAQEDAAAERSGLANSEAAQPTAAANAPSEEIRDQAWWENRFVTLRDSVERHAVLAEALQARINALTADVVSRDDPFQRAELRLQLQQAMQEYDRVQAEVIEGRRSLERLRDEARRAGAPPGWTR